MYCKIRMEVEGCPGLMLRGSVLGEGQQGVPRVGTALGQPDGSFRVLCDDPQWKPACGQRLGLERT